MFPLADFPSWNFTVTSGAQTCMQYQTNATGDFTLTVQGQVFATSAYGAMGARYTCPDGSSYTASNAFDLFNCPEGLTGSPGSSWSSSSSSVSFSLIGTDASSSSALPVFDCMGS